MKLIITIAHKILICISEENNFKYLISKKIDSTVAHVNKVVDILDEDGFITSEHIGRRRILKLTEKGEQAQRLLKELQKLE